MREPRNNSRVTRGFVYSRCKQCSQVSVTELKVDGSEVNEEMIAEGVSEALPRREHSVCQRCSWRERLWVLLATQNKAEPFFMLCSFVSIQLLTLF